MIEEAKHMIWEIIKVYAIRKLQCCEFTQIIIDTVKCTIKKLKKLFLG